MNVHVHYNNMVLNNNNDIGISMQPLIEIKERNVTIHIV